jgi:hypothetical protein
MPRMPRWRTGGVQAMSQNENAASNLPAALNSEGCREPQKGRLVSA